MSRRARKRLRSERSAQQRSREQRARQWQHFRRALLVVLGLMTVGISVAAALASVSPAWWSGVRDVPDAARHAQSLEAGLSRLAAGDAGPEWTVTVSEHSCNAWLEDRLPRWLHNRGVEPSSTFRRVRVSFHDGLMHTSLQRPEHAGWPAHVGASFHLAATDGSLDIRLKGFTVGRLPAPRELVRDVVGPALARLDDDPGELIADALRGETVSVAIEEVLPELTSIRVAEGGLVLSGRSASAH